MEAMVTDQILLNKILNSKQCNLWPECACNKTLVHWQSKILDNELEWTFEDLQWADLSIFITLSCVAERCPSRKTKTYALLQLLNPWWDRQRRGEELTEEFCERLRAKGRAKQNGHEIGGFDEAEPIA